VDAEVDLRHFLEGTVGKARERPWITAHHILWRHAHVGHRVRVKGDARNDGSPRVLRDWSQLAHARHELIPVGTIWRWLPLSWERRCCETRAAVVSRFAVWR
jgi:hypothetical protein